jgi:hypothetical protein
VTSERGHDPTIGALEAHLTLLHCMEQPSCLNRAMATKATSRSEVEDLTVTVPREKAVGAATGAVVGGIVGGPLGAVVGGAIGTLLSGKRKELKQAAATEVKAVKKKAPAVAKALDKAKKSVKKMAGATGAKSGRAKKRPEKSTAAKKKPTSKAHRKN